MNLFALWQFPWLRYSTLQHHGFFCFLFLVLLYLPSASFFLTRLIFWQQRVCKYWSIVCHSFFLAKCFFISFSLFFLHLLVYRFLAASTDYVVKILSISWIYPSVSKMMEKEENFFPFFVFQTFFSLIFSNSLAEWNKMKRVKNKNEENNKRSFTCVAKREYKEEIVEKSQVIRKGYWSEIECAIEVRSHETHKVINKDSHVKVLFYFIFS